jgi:hypothetical protein
MPIENLISNHFIAPEKDAVNASLSAIESVLNAKLRNLSPDERRKYGSINEQNKLIVNKTRDYHNSQPALSSPDVDWVEFENDYSSREFIQTVMARLQNLLNGLDNNKILHDYDNYQASLTDYGYSQYKAGTKTSGYEAKAKEVAQFFSRTGTSTTPPEVPPTV